MADGHALPSLPFSWRGVLYDAMTFVGNVCADASDFWHDAARQAGYAHNKFVDDYNARNDGEQFARDVLSGLNSL